MCDKRKVPFPDLLFVYVTMFWSVAVGTFYALEQYIRIHLSHWYLNMQMSQYVTLLAHLSNKFCSSCFMMVGHIPNHR